METNEQANEDQDLANQIVEIMAKMTPEGQNELFVELQNQYLSVQEEEKSSPEAEEQRKDEMITSTF